MSPRPNLQLIVSAATRALKRDVFLALAGAVTAMVASAFIVSWLLASNSWWPAPSVAPLVLELVLVAAAGFFAFRVMRHLQVQASERRIAAAGESALGLPEGSVRGVLELSRNVPAGTSSSLYQHAETSLANRLSGVSAVAFTGELGRSVRRQRVRSWAAAGALAVVLVILGFASPARSRAGWAPLLHPVAHLSPPPLPSMVVEPGSVEVPRGSALEIRIRAPQRDAVLLEWRSAGALASDATIELQNGSGAGRIADIDAAVHYWVKAPDGAVSDTFTITPTDPLLISELSVEITYPSYLSRPSEIFQTELPSLEVPEGTELRIRGRATRALAAAELIADSTKAQIALNVDGDAFVGRWVPRQSGQYRWELRGPNGVRAELVPAPFELTVIPDAPPEIEITYPGVDTTLTPDLQQSIIADARDDHGLLNAVLVSWRTSSAGQKDPVIEQPVTLEGDADRALIRGLLDARERNLLPGDTLSYFLRVTDNSPRRQTTSTPVYRLRLPSMNELREQAGEQGKEITKDLDELARAARELEKATRDLNRRAAGESQAKNDRTGQGGSQGNPGDKQMEFGKSEQTRSLLERQQQMLNQVDEMRQRVAALDRAMEAAGLKDPELQKRLQEMRELYDKLLTPELKKKLEELKQGVDKLDPEQVKKALEELAKQQQEMREQLERSLELMKRAAAEQEMNKLAQEAKELATQQEAVAEQMKQQGQSDKEKAEKQKEMAEQTKELSKALEELMKKLGQQGEAQASKQTGEAKEKTDQASKKQDQAAEQAGKQQGQQAAESGQQAADQLKDAAKSIEDARKQMAEGWKKEMQETMDKATNDALSMAQKQNEILQKMQEMQQQAQAGKQQQQQQGGQSVSPPQLGNQQQQGGGKQQQQQQGGKQQQQGQSQQGGQQQGGQQQGGQQAQQQQGKQGQQQQGGQQQQQQGGQQPGGQGAGGQSGGDMQQIKQDQAALKQGLEQLGKNLSEAGKQSAMMNRDVGSALGRANLSMEQVMKALEEASRMPTQEAEKTLDALNRLALELLKNQQQIQDAQAGSGLQQALEQMAELAKQQGGINGQSSSLAPLNVAPQSMADQLNRLAREQRDVAKKLGGMNNIGGREDVLGRIDELAKEAEAIAKELDGGRLTPQTLARQERLFHRLLDAGRTLERDEYDEERKAERPGVIPPHVAKALKPGLLDANAKYAVPSEEQLRGLPPAYRRLILEYFERLNRTPAPEKK